DGQVYNVSTGVGTTVAELARLVIEVAGRPVAPIYEAVAEGQYSTQMPGRIRLPSELRTLVQDPGKAGRELGWRPAVPLRRGIEREIGWVAPRLDRWSVLKV